MKHPCPEISGSPIRWPTYHIHRHVSACFSNQLYLISGQNNAYGPTPCEPRSGEIIACHIGIFCSVLNLEQKWYFAQCGANDPRFPNSRLISLKTLLADRKISSGICSNCLQWFLPFNGEMADFTKDCRSSQRLKEVVW